ncbi:hypothetical protein HYW17_03200 [Candidatus Uhrbacteria bacterium]|nr:hypothetical protein [Candidatus Uhrbacteria bacterium]
MTTANTGNYGPELLSWEIREYHQHARGLAWAIAAAAVGILLLIYAVSSRNFLFAFIVIMFGIIFATHSLRPPRAYRFIIAQRGIALGERFYPWKDIDHFWVVDAPPAVKTLYFEFGGLRPRLPIPLGEINPDSIRAILRGLVREDTSKTEEPISDWLARMLRI